MKIKIFINIVLFGLVCLVTNLTAQTGTFTFTGAVDNGVTVTSETVSGTTVTISNNESTDMGIGNSESYGFSGSIVVVLGSPSSLLLTFSQIVNITTIQCTEIFGESTRTWVFTPNTGSVVNVDVNPSTGTTATLNFVGISTITISILGGTGATFAIDNVIMDAALPVELTSFNAVLQNNTVTLNWETATEVNNYGFEVERSLVIGHQSLENWEVIGFVEGHGNSNSPKSYEFVDANPPAGSLKYRLKQIDTDGIFEYYSTTAEVNNNITRMEDPATAGLPTEFVLMQNYPNPFNPATTIFYSIPSSLVATHVSLIVYNSLGQQVATLVNEQKAPGRYKVNFDANGLSSGVFFYQLQAGGFVQMGKMLLIK